MFNQKKVTNRRIFKPIRMLSILFFAVLIPFTGYTADLDVDLINAVLQADTATVNALLATGSDANAKDRNGETVLIVAAKYGHTDVVKALLAQGAEVNAKNRDGQTALILAANNGHIDTVKALLAKGADLNAKDEFGETALACAKRCGHMRIASLLEEAGIKPPDHVSGTSF